MTQDHIRLMQYDEHLWTWLAYRRYLVRLELQRAMKTFRSHNPELPKEDAEEMRK